MICRCRFPSAPKSFEPIGPTNTIVPAAACRPRTETKNLHRTFERHPQPADIGLALREDRHRCVVAVQSAGGENMSLDPAIEGH